MNSILENRRIRSQLPPGPKVPASWQTVASWKRPTVGLERARKRYGKRFTIRLLGQPPFVVLSDPDDIKELFQAPPDVLHPGEGARILEPIVGPNSVILLDEAPHLEQRKLLLPAFHGENMQSLADLMTDLTEREVSSWPHEQAIALHPRLQRLTLEIVLRAVFGLEQGAQLDRLRELLTQVLEFAESPLSLLPFAQRMLAGRGPVGRLERLGEEADKLIFEVIDERRREGEGGPDVLALLLSARHEDGSPMSPAELRDELVTALVAGHETTASQLAWGFEQLSRLPHVVERLAGELAEDSEDDAYLTATIHEIMRRRPVLINAEPRLVKKPVQIGGVEYPAGVVLIANAYLVHHDPAIYPDPYAFRPERFLESEGGRAPGTYTWLPFGGGRRRCLGASFAMLEMKIVLRAVIEHNLLLPVGERPETARRRSITISPSRGCEVILRERPSSTGAGERSAQPTASLAGVA
ncbi:MAG TPA: cytochrome P450 [Solirubrobacteraceae bacterium]|jgi:cytochrome P450|nr:cytochrome P450 [Solirubrobacteraceae bacterium]